MSLTVADKKYLDLIAVQFKYWLFEQGFSHRNVFLHVVDLSHADSLTAREEGNGVSLAIRISLGLEFCVISADVSAVQTPSHFVFDAIRRYTQIAKRLQVLAKEQNIAVLIYEENDKAK